MFFTTVAAAVIYNKPQSREYLDGKEDRVVTPGEMLFMLMVFLLEVAIMIWALVLAWKCGKSHKDRFIHVVFAMFFPVFYILYYFISGCGAFDKCD